MMTSQNLVEVSRGLQLTHVVDAGDVTIAAHVIQNVIHQFIGEFFHVLYSDLRRAVLTQQHGHHTGLLDLSLFKYFIVNFRVYKNRHFLCCFMSKIVNFLVVNECDS